MSLSKLQHRRLVRGNADDSLPIGKLYFLIQNRVFYNTATTDTAAFPSGVSAYFATNMDFLNKDIRDTFVNEYPYIETKPKDEPPAKYNIGAEVTDSIVGSGTIFNGKVDHSIVFRVCFLNQIALRRFDERKYIVLFNSFSRSSGSYRFYRGQRYDIQR